MTANEAPKLTDIDTTEIGKDWAGIIDQAELTTFLKNENIIKENKKNFVDMINIQKETMKRLPWFTDSLKATAKDIADKLKTMLETKKLNDFDKITEQITLADGKTQLTKNECAKILQVYAAIILDKNLTITKWTYKNWAEVLFDFESKHTFGPQMNAIINHLSPNNSKTTKKQNKYESSISEAYNNLEKKETETTKEVTKSNAINIIYNSYPESDGYNLKTMKKINEIKTSAIQSINNATSSNDIDIIENNTIQEINKIIEPLLTEKKQRTKNILTENAMHIQSQYTPDKIQNFGKKVQEQIDKATTPAQIDKIIAEAQTEIKNIPTKYQEKQEEQDLAQKESDVFTYEKVEKEWKVNKAKEVNIPITIWLGVWASIPITENISTSRPTELKDESKNLNTFMKLNSEKENIFNISQTKDLVDFITKNYPSLSKNSEIRDQINKHIKQYLKEKDKNHDLNITLPRELTAISLEIDTKTGEYYFNIPAEGNFGTNYPAPKIDAIHLGIDGKVTTFDETKNSDSILVSIYTKGTLAYTLTHNTYNDQFADLPGHIIPGTYQNKKDLLLIEAIKTTKNEKIQDNIQNYKILTVEPDKITIEVTSKPKKNSPEWTLIIGRHNWAIGSGWKDKATTEVTSAKADW